MPNISSRKSNHSAPSDGVVKSSIQRSYYLAKLFSPGLPHLPLPLVVHGAFDMHFFRTVARPDKDIVGAWALPA